MVTRLDWARLGEGWTISLLWDGKGKYIVFAEKLYPTVEQSAVLFRSSKKATAQAVFGYLCARETRTIEALVIEASATTSRDEQMSYEVR